MSAWITNENLYDLLSAMALLLMLRAAREGLTWKRAVALGAVLGAALLSKTPALFLGIPAAVLFSFDWRKSWRYAVLAFGVTAAVAGWWFVTNAVVYHDPLGVQAQYASIYVLRRDPLAFSLTDNLAQVVSPFASMWISLGYNTGIRVPPPFHWLFAGLMAAAPGGGLLKLWRARRKALAGLQPLSGVSRLAWVTLAFALSLSVAIIFFELTNIYARGGRYLFAGIPVWAALLAWGWDAFTPARHRLRLALTSTLVTALVTLLILFGYYLPVFRLIPPPADIAHPLHWRYGDSVELLGSSADQIEARPGEIVPFTLYWRALNTTQQHLIVELHTSGFTLFEIRTHPAQGLLSSEIWRPGQTWSEYYRLPISEDTKPGTYRVAVLVYDYEASTFLPITAASDPPRRAVDAARIIVR
jgi:hypothetical protein